MSLYFVCYIIIFSDSIHFWEIDAKMLKQYIKHFDEELQQTAIYLIFWYIEFANFTRFDKRKHTK